MNGTATNAVASAGVCAFLDNFFMFESDFAYIYLLTLLLLMAGSILKIK